MNAPIAPAVPMDAAERGDFTRHEEASVELPVTADVAFAYLDDHRNLASHMSQSSWMMVGSSMEVRLDATGGRAIGSKIELIGRVLGMRLSVTEIVTEHDVPRRKSWATVGAPKLLVIGAYRMGFDVAPREGRSALRIFIDYDLPNHRIARWLPWLGRWYARWCTAQMTRDAVTHFRRQSR